MRLNNGLSFIAEIGGNHDGSLERALELIRLAAKAGATAAKFQHYTPGSLVDPSGIDQIPASMSPHKRTGKEVLDILQRLAVPPDWNQVLARECKVNDLDFITAPYDLSSIQPLSNLVDYFKVGSGDLQWLEKLEILKKSGKEIVLSTGASTFDEVVSAMDVLNDCHERVTLMQCNSNYDASQNSLNATNLRVLEAYKLAWPDVKLGLSDHQKSLAPVLGSIALGARVIERHFTDDNSRNGADHRVALEPEAWKEMVTESTNLISCLGSSIKKVQPNETGTRITQRRALRYSKDLKEGSVLSRDCITILRPALPGTLPPSQLENVLGKTIRKGVEKDAPISLKDFEND